MSDDIWKRNEIESPCVKVCVVHPEARLCVGCLRSIEEIGGWGRMSADQRQAIMQDLPARQGMIAKRRGGRAARAAG
jgi:predicted Fe-S protein YdhL (DUF1289 family)